MFKSLITRRRMDRFLMKMTMVLMSAALFLPTFVPIQVNAADAEAENVTVYAVDALQHPFYGYGTQFDPFIGSDKIAAQLTEQQWDQVMTRAEYMRMGFARVATAPNAFSPTLTVGVYDWETEEMQQLYRILDRLKADGTTVLLSSWRYDYFRGDIPELNASKEYVDMMIDALDYLINDKGYTNIKYLQHNNEPKSNKITWDGYKQVIAWYKEALDSRNLHVELMGTGNQPGTGLFAPNYQLELAPYLGAYDIHYYPSQSIIAGASDKLLETRVNDLSSSPKPLFITEAGSFDNVTGADDQPNVVNSWYALHQVDYAIQAVFQGVSGMSAWMMDDSMHDRLWGMWDIFDSPDPRPWFYTYSLLSRYVEQGSTVYKPQLGNDRTSRILVSSKPAGDNANNWTIAAVNRGTEDREFTVRIPGVANATWDLYKYTENYHPADADLLPIKDSEITNADMTKSGVSFTVPSNGFVLLTTSDQQSVAGTPLADVSKLPFFTDFNDDTAGSAPVGWGIQGDVTIQDISSEGNKSMRVSGDSGAGITSAIQNFVAESAPIIEEFDIKVDQTDQRVNAGMLKKGTDIATEIYFDTDDNLYYEGNGSRTMIMPYNAETWYHFKVAADPSTGKFDIYVDDLAVPKVTQASFKANSPWLDNVEFSAPEESSAKFNVDNVKIHRFETHTLPIFSDFNQDTAGMTPSGWEYKGYNVAVEDMQGSGNKSLRVSGDSAADVTTGAVCYFDSQSGSIIVEFDIRVGQTNQRVNAGILKNGRDMEAEIYFDANGNLYVSDSGSETEIMPYNANVWYHIKMIADPTTGQYNVYVNDMDTPKVSHVSFVTKNTSINNVEFNAPAGSNGNFNLDNVRIYRLFVDESFDDQTTGAAPIGWDIAGNHVSVVEEPSASDKSLRIDGSSAGTDSAAIGFEAQNKRIVLGYDIKLDSAKVRVKSGYLYSGDTAAVVVYFDTDGRIRYYNGNRSAVLADTYNANMWYKFKIVVDISANRFDIYFNDMNLPLKTNVPFMVSTDNLDRILFEDPGISNASFHLNNVYAYSEERVPSADANLNDIIVSPGTLSPAFNTETTDYQLDVSHGTESVAFTPISSSPHAMMSVNGTAIGSDGSLPVVLTPGEDRQVNIEVKAQEGTTTKQYQIRVIELPPIEVESVTLNKEELSLETGESESLTATIMPSEATNQQVTWSSSDPNVASVSATGEITAVSAGMATITVTTEDGSYTAECVVTVTAAPEARYAVVVEHGEGSGSYVSGNVVAITAQPAPDGQVFDKWIADNSSVVFEDSSAMETTFVMPDEAVTITATYKDTTPPMWPTGSQLLASSVGKTGLTLSWTAANGDTGVTHYKLYKNGTEFATLPVESTSYDVTDLLSNTAYAFKVEAGNSADHWSVDGPSVTVTTAADSSGDGGTPTPTPTPTPIPTPTPTSTPTPTPTSTPTPTPTPTSTPKVDLSDVTNHWAAAAIQKSVELGFVNGYENGTFKPNKIVTRGEFATMLARALKLELDDAGFGFSDQDQTPAWAKPFIQAIANAGFISGYEDGSFRTNNGITRSESAVILVRALGMEINPNASLEFDDAAQVPVWAKPYVATAAEAGLIKGNGNGKFNPNDSATRAEAVTLILAMLDHLK